MINRLINNYATTVLGVSIEVVAIVLLANGIIDGMSFGLLTAQALIFLRAKNSLIGLKAK